MAICIQLYMCKLNLSTIGIYLDVTKNHIFPQYPGEIPGDFKG